MTDSTSSFRSDESSPTARPRNAPEGPWMATAFSREALATRARSRRLPSSPPPREPWYYRCIETSAKMDMGLCLFVFASPVLAAIGVALRLLRDDPNAGYWTAVAGVIVGPLCLPALLGVLLVVAYMPLSVDVARSLREVRRHVSGRRP